MNNASASPAFSASGVGGSAGGSGAGSPLSSMFSAAAVAALGGGPGAAPGVATSVAGGHLNPLQEAIMSRIRGPFGMMDLTAAGFSAAGGLGGLVRPDTFPGLSLLNPHSFLHPALESRLPGMAGSGAGGAGFRPMFPSLHSGTDSLLKSSSNSAFQPHPNRSEKSIFSPGHNIFPRGSPASSRSSPSPIASQLKTDENSNTENNNNGNNGHSNGFLATGSPEESADDDERCSKRMRLSGLFGCPICGIGLTAEELDAHYTQELDYLTKLSLGIYRSADISRQSLSRYCQSPGYDHNAPRTRWESFQRVQRNRQSRLRVKLCRKVAKRQDEILMEEGQGEDIDIVGEDKQDQKSPGKDQKDQDLTSVAGQDTGIYGPSQFSEDDLDQFLQERHQADSLKTEDVEDEEDRAEDKDFDTKPEKDEVEAVDEAEAGQGEEAEAKLEAENGKANHSSCCVCKGELVEGVVSLKCWHVKCKKCWFLQMAGKKNCSICGTSNTLTQLRKVYL